MWAIYATPFRPPMGCRGRGCCVTLSRLSFKRRRLSCSGGGGLSVHDIVDGPVRLSLGKTTGMNDAGRAWSSLRPTFVVTKTSVICAKAQSSTCVVMPEGLLTEWLWLWPLAGSTCCAEATVSGLLRLKCSGSVSKLPR